MNKLKIQNQIVVDHSKLREVKAEISTINHTGDRSHNPKKPIFYWYQDSPIGKELFVVFYTKKCEWSRCSFCSLPSVSSPVQVDDQDVIEQAEYIFKSLSTLQLNRVVRVLISNNGSVLNQNTLPSHVLYQLCELSHKYCEKLRYISFETRFESAEKKELLYYIRMFKTWHELYHHTYRTRKENNVVQLQISAGYETQDPYIRNAILCKGYAEKEVQKFFSLCSEIYEETGYKISCDEYVLLKPAIGMNDKEAIEECVQTIKHLYKLGKAYNVPVSIRLNPIFVAKGSYLHAEFIKNNYTPPSLSNVVDVIKRCFLEIDCLQIFVGLNEENLSIGGQRYYIRSDIDYLYLKILKIFNSNQDYKLLLQNIKLVDSIFQKSVIGKLMLKLIGIVKYIEEATDFDTKKLLDLAQEIESATNIKSDLLKCIDFIGNLQKQSQETDFFIKHR